MLPHVVKSICYFDVKFEVHVFVEFASIIYTLRYWTLNMSYGNFCDNFVGRLTNAVGELDWDGSLIMSQRLLHTFCSIFDATRRGNTSRIPVDTCCYYT
jgi:hypothetical protein